MKLSGGGRAALGTALLALMCAACAAPSTKEADEFGKAATASLTILTDAHTAYADLLRERGIEQRTHGYLENGEIVFASSLVCEDNTPFTDQQGKELLQDQFDLLTALSDYATAISEAAADPTNPAAASNLDAASKNLSSNAAKTPGAATSKTPSTAQFFRCGGPQRGELANRRPCDQARFNCCD
jgi:hypothetical protein